MVVDLGVLGRPIEDLGVLESSGLGDLATFEELDPRPPLLTLMATGVAATTASTTRLLLGAVNQIIAQNC